MTRIVVILLGLAGWKLWDRKYEKLAKKLLASTVFVALAGIILYVFHATKTREWNPFVGDGSLAVLPLEFCIWAYVFVGITWGWDRLFSNRKLWQKALHSRVMGALAYLSWAILLITLVNQFITY